MHLLFAVIADDYRGHPDGREDIIGVHHRLDLATVPTTIDMLFVLQFLITPTDRRARVNEFAVVVFDPARQVIYRGGGTQKWTPQHESGAQRPTIATYPVRDKVSFKSSGHHEVEVRAGTLVMATIPLLVALPGEFAATT